MTALSNRPESAPGQSLEDPDLVRARRRFARRRWVRRLLVLRPLLIGVGVVVVAAGLVWLFFFSSVLDAEAVEVHGTDYLSADAVARQAGVPLGDPLARVDLDAVQARIEGLVAVQSVEVTRSWPHAVRIDVHERTAVAVVEREGDLQALDRDGVVFRPYAHRPPGLPLVRTRATTDADALAEAAHVVSALEPRLRRRVAYLEVSTVDEISLHLRGGARVVWGSAEGSSDKARVLEALIHQQPQARGYNVSAPGSPSVRP